MFKLLMHASLLLTGFCLAACNLFPQPIPPSTVTLPPTRYRLPATTPRVYSTPTPRPTRTPIPSRTLTSTPPPLPPLSGRLLLLTGLTELRWLDFDGSSVRLGDPLVNDLRHYAPSPDGRSLVFSGLKTTVTLLDLVSGELRPLVAANSVCFRWSPASARFTYTRDTPSPALYVYELASGQSTKIVDFPCGSYMGNRLGGSSSRPGVGTLCGEISCGAWLDETHLLFRHYTGALPEKVTDTGFGNVGENSAYRYIELRAQHTTIASFAGRKVKLVDLPELWYELERCPYGPYLLLRKEWGSDNPTYISPVFTDFSGLQPTPLPEIKNATLYLAPPIFADRQCHLFYRHKGGLHNERWVSLLNPMTFDVAFTSAQLPINYVRPDGRQVNGDWSWNGAWVGNPQQQIIAIDKTSELGSAVTLVDLQTGAYTILADLAEVNVSVLAWVAR